MNIFEGHDATSMELLVQLKATESVATGDNEAIVLDTKTYNYLSDKLQVVMLVKFVIPESEAYWILLKDVLPPDESQKTFTIGIPKSNRLSQIEWEGITGHIRKVAARKLAANRLAEQRDRDGRSP